MQRWWIIEIRGRGSRRRFSAWSQRRDGGKVWIPNWSRPSGNISSRSGGHADTIDPGSSRDLSQVWHREVFIQALSLFPGVEPGFGEALYAVMADQWVAFDDTMPVLTELAERGVPIVVVSNIGIDIRPFLSQAGLADKLDGVVLSYEVGAVKPQPEIFAHALDLLDMPAGDALMVGDSWRDDAGAAAVGIRTLILPRTSGPSHGLEAVLRLVRAP